MTLSYKKVLRILRDHGITESEFLADFNKLDRYPLSVIHDWLGY